MASPTTDFYGVASGQPVAGGRFRLPLWVPATGNISNVSFNNLEDVRGSDDLSQTRAIMSAWSGAAFVSSYGKYGSIICTGGGHSDGVLNAVYRYDIDTRTWTKIKTSATSYLDSSSLNADSVTGWMWADSSGTTVQTGEPFAAHLYAGLVGLPASAISGAANGWIITAGRTTMPLTAGAGTSQSSKLRLGEDNTFTAHGSALVRGTGYGGACWDSYRNRLVSFSGTNVTSYCYLDLTTSSVGTLAYTKSSGYPELDCYYRCAFYDAANDLYMVVKVNSGYAFNIVTPSTGLITTPTVSGTAPTGSGGWEWVESWGALVFYPGSGNTVWTLKRPSNPLTGTWTWGSQTVSGVANSQSGGNPHYKRFIYSPMIDCFLWVSAANQSVQAFRVVRP